MSRPLVPIRDRLWAKVVIDKSTGCWNFTGARVPPKREYGKIGAGGGGNGWKLAHRASYEIFVGPIPTGMAIDHLCENKICVNPAHLEPVTQLVNTQRYYAKINHCKNGHPFDEANTRVTEKGYRQCRACGRDFRRKYVARRRALLGEPSSE